MWRASLSGLIVIAGLAVAAQWPDAVGAAEMQIVVEGEWPASARRALDELRRVVPAKHTLHVVSRPDPARSHTLLAGIAGHSPLLDRALAEAKLVLPEEAESLAIRRVGPDRQTLLVAGRDAVGLGYALRDIARSLELAPPDADPFAAIIEETAAPTLAVRNVSVHFANADVEREWYFSEEFWNDYFRMLSLHRFNHVTLTYSDQSNYLCPLYAHLLDMPEYPQVRVDPEVARDRAKHLAMLRRIAELADEHGLALQLAIWMQSPVPRYSAAVRVTGLPTGRELADYCALGLSRLLRECPKIRGVQLRMNEESGVPEAEQADFFRPIFRALRAVGRPLRVDLRYKGLQSKTIAAAVEEKLDVTVSTKYWAEHFGLPYHPTAVDSHYRKDRYSFGSLLKEPRPHRVTYQLWTVGSQRLTVWGDPDYARRFAESCRLGGGEGFEVFAPLCNQGYGNLPGAWRAIARPADRVGRWAQDRYWFFYLCFGRLGYHPRTEAEVWRREFRHRFGSAAPHVEEAYRQASRVLPFITATCLPSASEWHWWPEMDTAGTLRDVMHAVPSDPRQFSSIRPWERTPKWRWEDWDASPGFVDDVRAGKISGKWSPPRVAARFEHLAEQIDKAWTTATATPRDSAEWRMTRVDHGVLSQLARFHAARIRAATEWAFFESDQQAARWPLLLAHAERARDAWKRIVEGTDGAYHANLVFGIAVDSPRSKFGNHHTGHWRDRLVEIEKDLDELKQQARERIASSQQVPLRRWPLETVNAWPVVRVPEGIDLEWRPDGSAQLRVKPTANVPLRRAILHVRALDQTQEWREIEMTARADRPNGPPAPTASPFVVTLPRDSWRPGFDLQAYVEFHSDHSGTLWPSWEETQPYVVLRRPSRAPGSP